MEEGISRKRFIRLGAAIGVTTVGASVVAACGGGESGGGGGGDTATSGGATSGGGTTSTEPSGETTATQGSGGDVIAQVSAVQQGSAQKFTNEGQPAVLVHLQGGDFVAYSAVCTHQQCTVAYQDGLLACPCHGSLFDPSEGGQVVQGPAEQPLPEIPVQVQNGAVTKA